MARLSSSSSSVSLSEELETRSKENLAGGHSPPGRDSSHSSLVAGRRHTRYDMPPQVHPP